MRVITRLRTVFACSLSAATVVAATLAGCDDDGGPDQAAAAATAPQDPTMAATSEGPVRGVTTSSVIRYLGIPYAAPPTGSLRWRAPVAPPARSVTLDASTFRSNCLQGTASNPSGNEDCLYLNVYRPIAGGLPATKAPVFVWIHGGGYAGGSGSSYDLGPMAVSQNIVGVTINYRLGTLGFLAHPALSLEETPRRSGNYGLLDMQIALAWVRKNIASFGGDPANVTIFGESAGGNAVYTQYASPSAAGLFDKAVAMSGGYYRNQPLLAAAEQTGAAAAGTSYGCPDTALDPLAQPAVAQCLRSLSATATLNAVLVEPNVDGKVLVESTASAFRNGRFNHVPLMAGSTHDEGTLFVAGFLGSVSATNYASFGTLNLPAATVAARYPLANYVSPIQAVAAAVGDYHMFCGAMQDVDSVSQFVPNAYFYEWNDQQPASGAAFQEGFPPTIPGLVLGAGHGLDIAYWLDLILSAEATPARSGLSNAMTTYLGNFARTGDPNGSGTTTWLRYTATTRTTMLLSYPLNPNYNAFAAHNCDLWYPVTPSESLS